MPTVRTLTRQADRAKARHARAITFHFARVRAAKTGWARLIAALNYAQAVGKRLGDAERTNLAKAIVAAADHANTQGGAQ